MRGYPPPRWASKANLHVLVLGVKKTTTQKVSLHMACTWMRIERTDEVTFRTYSYSVPHALGVSLPPLQPFATKRPHVIGRTCTSHPSPRASLPTWQVIRNTCCSGQCGHVTRIICKQQAQAPAERAAGNTCDSRLLCFVYADVRVCLCPLTCMHM